MTKLWSPAGLYNRYGASMVPWEKAHAAWNWTPEKGGHQARGGIWERARAPFWTLGCRLLGIGYGKWNGVEEFLMVCRLEGDQKASPLAVLADGTPQAPHPDWLDTRDAGPWRMCQFDDSVYAINEKDGLWRKKIGKNERLDWDAVPYTYTSDLVGGAASLLKPPYDERRWDSATDAVAFPGAANNAQRLPGWDQTGTPGVDADLVEIDANTGSVNMFAVDRGQQKAVPRPWTFVVRPNHASSGVDLSQSRLLALLIESDQIEDVRPHEELQFLANRGQVVRVFLSTSASADATNLSAAAWRECSDVKWEGLYPREGRGAARGYDGVAVWADAQSSGLTTSELATVRSIAVLVEATYDAKSGASLAPLYLGGAYLNKGFPDKPVEYAYQYVDTTAPVQPESAPVFLSVSASRAQGSNPYGDSLPGLGAQAKVDAVAGAGVYAVANGYDKIRLWRRRWSGTNPGWWVCIAQAANPVSGTVQFTDSRVDAADETWSTVSGVDDRSDFTGAGQAPTFSGTAICAWKTHLVVGAGPLVFFSYANNPGLYLPPPVPGTAPRETEDDTIGRTLYLAQDRSDRVVALAPSDVLYLVGERGVYAMVGDSAVDASPPRELPGSRGTRWPDAVCVYRGGVCVAATDGLWWYQANRALAESDESIHRAQNLTADVPETWRLLMGGSDDPVCVTTYADELLATRGTRYMRRRDDGEWEYGQIDDRALESGSDGAPPIGGPYQIAIGGGLPSPGTGGGIGGVMPGKVGADDGSTVYPPGAGSGNSQTCDDTAGNWQISVSVVARWTGTGGGSGVFTTTSAGKGHNGIGFVKIVGVATIAAKWVGAGDPPDVCAVNISATVTAVTENGTGPCTADNGLGSPQTPTLSGVTSTGSLVVAIGANSQRTVRFAGQATEIALPGSASVSYSVSAAVAPGGCSLL